MYGTAGYIGTKKAYPVRTKGYFVWYITDMTARE